METAIRIKKPASFIVSTLTAKVAGQLGREAKILTMTKMRIVPPFPDILNIVYTCQDPN